MVISVITLFPGVFHPLLESSILSKAQKQGNLQINLVNLRDFGIGRYRQVDDRIYGGGVGMILRVEPIAAAIAKSKISAKGGSLSVRQAGALGGKNQKSKGRSPSGDLAFSPRSKVILLTPQGKTFNQKMARRLTKEKHLILICGKYEGVDERVRKLADEEISIGDYVLSGGEIAAMAVVDSVTRLLPGVLDREATKNESFTLRAERPMLGSPKAGRPPVLLEPPQYTRPEEFKGMKVPEILLSGNHQKIAAWRRQEALKKTKKLRPDLLSLRAR
ncbi:MAG: tRNA (guanosine(37)-N1)-methyltransferase TrmD [candidate division WWE3 bacterium]|nr:tRNA (guanosine(37)-N1)-methyltransferase TrmD [candidate division WWE3 bacterium]